jgi:hypothetical protein
MICAHLSDAAIEMTAAQLRAAKVVANRRALAALLHHHGDRPPEAGCSAEARRIRQHLGKGAAIVEASSLEASEPVDDPATKASLHALAAEVATRRDVPLAMLLNPPRRAAKGSIELRAQLANREAMYRAYHDVCPDFRLLGRHFGKDYNTVRRAAGHHAATMGAHEGMGE